MEERKQSFPLFGREDILGRLEQRLEGLKKGYRQNLSLIGPRHIGKTYLLRHFLDQIRQDPEIISIYLSLKRTDFDRFVERWIGSILQGFLSSQRIPFPDEFQLLVKTSRAFIPKTLERMREIKKHAVGKRMAAAFRELLNLTGALREETGKKVLFILDEFQSLEGIEVGDPFGLFGKEMMIQKDTLYLTTSSEPQKAREIFASRLSLLFGNFEVLEVGPLSLEAIRSWVEQEYPDLEIPDSDLKFLSHLLGNRPYYFGLFLEAAWAAKQRRKLDSWDRGFLLDLIEELVFSDHGLLNQHFELELGHLSRYGRQVPWCVKILLAMAHGRFKALPIVAYMGRQGTETQKILQRLVQDEILVKRGSFFCLPDPLFRFWLRNVFQAKERELEPYGDRARRYFQARLVEEIRKVDEEDKRDLVERVEALFQEFRNDIVEVNQKKIKCPAFLEIASRPTNGRFFPILGRTSRGRWFCQVSREVVTEGDVAAFIEELKRFRRKIERRMIIATRGIELNAKLMAQEAKIQIWDLENFNALLELYGKLKIIP